MNGARDLPGPDSPPAFQLLSFLLQPFGFPEECQRRFGPTFIAVNAGQFVIRRDLIRSNRYYFGKLINGTAPPVTCGKVPFHFSSARNSRICGLDLSALDSMVMASAFPRASAIFWSASNLICLSLFFAAGALSPFV